MASLFFSKSSQGKGYGMKGKDAWEPTYVGFYKSDRKTEIKSVFCFECRQIYSPEYTQSFIRVLYTGMWPK